MGQRNMILTLTVRTWLQFQLLPHHGSRLFSRGRGGGQYRRQTGGGCPFGMARELGIHRDTARRFIDAESPPTRRPPQSTSDTITE